MRLIAAFVVLCAVLVGWIVWAVMQRPAPAPGGAAESPVLVWPPPPPPDSPTGPAEAAPAEEDAPSAAQAPAAAVVAGPAPASSPIRWAGDASSFAAQRLERALETLADDPFHEDALDDAVACAAELEQWELLAELRGRQAALGPADGDRRLAHAAALMRVHRWVDAQSQLRVATELRPEDAEAWFNLATCLQQTRDLAEALEAWNRVLELAPAHLEARERRAETLLDLNRWEPAAADLRAVIGAKGATQPLRLNLSLALLRLGRFDEASEQVGAGLEEQPRSVPLLNRAAEIAWARYETTPRAELARQVVSYCSRSLECAPQQPDVQALLEQAQSALGG